MMIPLHVTLIIQTQNPNNPNRMILRHLQEMFNTYSLKSTYSFNLSQIYPNHHLPLHLKILHLNAIIQNQNDILPTCLTQIHHHQSTWKPILIRHSLHHQYHQIAVCTAHIRVPIVLTHHKHFIQTTVPLPTLHKTFHKIRSRIWTVMTIPLKISRSTPNQKL